MSEHKADEFGKVRADVAALNSGDGQVAGTTLIMLEGIDAERDANPYIVHTPMPGATLRSLVLAIAALFLVGIGISVYLFITGAFHWPPRLVELSHKSVMTSRPLAVTVINRSGVALKALSLEGAGGRHLAVLPAVTPTGRVTVTPSLDPRGQNTIVLRSRDGRNYVLVDAVQGNPGGEVTVSVTRVSGGRLIGEVDDRAGGQSASQRSLEARR